MIGKISKIALIISVSVVGFWSCLKTEEFPPEPEIKYKEFVFTDISNNPDSIGYFGTLKFTFTDGDGDLGLEQSDTVPPHDYNLFMTFYEKINGQYLIIEPVDTALGFNYRIPNLTPSGQNKSLQGTIAVALLDPYPLSDTVKIEFYIKDRALNQSNTESSNELIIVQ